MFPQISIERLISPPLLPMPEPVSFGFDEMVKAKAEFMAESERSDHGNAEEIRNILLKTPRTAKAPAGELSEEGSFGNVYGAFGRYDIAEELTELKRRRNRR